MRNTNDYMQAKLILNKFAQVGFKKTSMEDIAKSINVSRQSVYKKFESKEKCYQWTIHTYLNDIYFRIFDILNNETNAPLESLNKVFDILIGESIDIVNQNNGPEVLNDTLMATHASQEDWPLRLRARLAHFMVKNGYASEDSAEGLSFTLICAGKGLLIEEKDKNNFTKKMATIIKSVVNK